MKICHLVEDLLVGDRRAPVSVDSCLQTLPLREPANYTGWSMDILASGGAQHDDHVPRPQFLSALLFQKRHEIRATMTAGR